MGKVKDDSNFQIYGWMTNKLKLKGNELLIYAIIYSFSRNNKGEGVFNASTAYLCEWANSSRQSITDCLNSLLNKKFIIKVEDNSRKKKPNVYKINESIFDKTCKESLQEHVNKVDKTCKESLQEHVNKVDKTCKESLPNNNIINTKYNTKINPNNNITDEEEALGKVCEMYAKEITGKLYCSPHEVKRLTELANVYGIENVKKAINKAVEYNKKSMVYINGILKNSSKAKKQTEQLPDEYNIPF